MSPKGPGTLIIAGGREEKAPNQSRTILTEVTRRAAEREGSIVVLPTATSFPHEVATEYVPIFRELGARSVKVVDVRDRRDAYDERHLHTLSTAGAVFFTGGDQLRITSRLGGTPLSDCLHDLYARGGTLAGTSAGAAAMAETMLFLGPHQEVKDIRAVEMAPGLGLVPNVVIDTHFTERGRIGRLLTAIARNSKNLGLGIDENTAIVLEKDHFRVIGTGAVYVVDGSGLTYSDSSDHTTRGVVTLHGITLHVLAAGSVFDLGERRPLVTANT